MADNTFTAPEADDDALREVRPQRQKTSRARSADTSRTSVSEARAESRERDPEERDFSEIQKLITEDTYDILPGLPQDDPHWHYCWLSTTNEQDSIIRRMQRGYEPVRPDSVPGGRDLQSYSAKTGQYAGQIMVNEMVLFRVPRRVWEMQMNEYHQRRPAEFEEAIRAKDHQMTGVVEGAGGKVIQDRDALLTDDDSDVGIPKDFGQPLIGQPDKASRWS
jgi:hypothetical protein